MIGPLLSSIAGYPPEVVVALATMAVASLVWAV